MATGLGLEVLLLDVALAGILAGVLPTADDEQGVHPTVPCPVRVVLESRFAYRAMGCHEEGDAVAGAEDGGHGDLGVHGGAASPDGGLRVAPGAAIEVEARPQPAPEIVDFLERAFDSREQCLQAGQRIAGAGGSAPDTGIAGAGIRQQSARRTHQHQEQRRQ